MRLLAGLLVLVTIAFVQSRPAISQLNDLNAAIASLPSLQNLNNQLKNVFAKLAISLSPAQLESLQQQTFQLAKDVIDRKVDVSAAVQQLSQQLQQIFGSNSQVLSTLQPLIQQLVDAVRSVLQSLSSNVGTRSVTIGGTDLVVLANQFGIHGLDDIINVFPHHKNLIYQLVDAADRITSALTDPQLAVLEKQAYELAQKVFDREVEVSVAVNVLFKQLQEYFGTSSPLLESVKHLIPKLVAGVHEVLSLLPSNADARSATGVHADLLALAQQFNFNSLDDVINAFPQHAGLINQLVNVAGQLISVLGQGDLYALEQQAFQLGQAVFEGKIDVGVAAQQIFQELKQRLGSNAYLLDNAEPLMQQLVEVARPFLQ